MRIEIKDFPVFLKLGHFEYERIVGQDALISIVMDLHDDLGAKLADDLGNTVCYGEVVKVINKTLENRQINLIETVVELVGTALTEKFVAIASLEVCVEKTVLPADVMRGAKVTAKKIFTREARTVSHGR